MYEHALAVLLNCGLIDNGIISINKTTRCCLLDGQSQHISDAIAIGNMSVYGAWCMVWCNGLFYVSMWKWNSVRLKLKSKRIVETTFAQCGATQNIFSTSNTLFRMNKKPTATARPQQNGINECECHFQHISQTTNKIFYQYESFNASKRTNEESCMQCTRTRGARTNRMNWQNDVRSVCAPTNQLSTNNIINVN